MSGVRRESLRDRLVAEDRERRARARSAPSSPREKPEPLAPDRICTVSPSQHGTEESCLRKWGFQTLLGLRHDTAASLLGTAVHAHRDKYLRTGEPIDQTTKAGIVAATGLRELPPPGSVEVEVDFYRWIREPSRVAIGNVNNQRVFGIDGGLAHYGLIDFRDRSNPRFTLVGDHKSTSDLKWAKSEAQLRSDPQWNTYVDAEFKDRPEIDYVKTRWLYITTRKPHVSKPVELVADRDDKYRLRIVNDLEQRAKMLEEIRRAPPEDVNELPPNFDACRDYGGCPFQGRECRATLGALFQPKKQKQTTEPLPMADFKDRLKKFKAKQTGNTDPVNPKSQKGKHDDDMPDEETTEEQPTTSDKRGRGRPPGSLNKPKEVTMDTAPIVEAINNSGDKISGSIDALTAKIGECMELAIAVLFPDD